MKSECKALLNKADQSLQAAAALKQDGFLDFAASRVYYAMSYTAEALLTEQGLTYSSHAAVIGEFGKLFSKTGKLDPRYHCYLLDAQDTRNIGDYGIGPGVSIELLDETMSRAKEFLLPAEALLA